MTLAELIARYREETHQYIVPYLVSDAYLTLFANEAEEQACRRAKLLVDSDTESVCKIPLVADQAEYALDSRVLQIRKARLTGKTYPLDRVTLRVMDQYKPGWEASTGAVSAYIPDLESRKIRVYKTPIAAVLPAVMQDIWLTVVRLPMIKMALSASVTFQDTGDTVTHVEHGRLGGDRVSFSVITGTTGIAINTEYFIRDVTPDTYKLSATSGGAVIPLTTNGTGTALYGGNSPEIEEKHHADLISWMKFRVYSIEDAEIFNPGLAKMNYDLFESVFGPIDTAIDADLLPVVNGVAR